MSTQHIATFIEAQAAELDASDNTQSAYARDLLDFQNWLIQKSANLLKADRAQIEGYLVFCSDQGLARATRARRLSAIKQFFRFAFEEGWRQTNPAVQIRGPGREKSLPKTLTIEEVEKLLQAARNFGRTKDHKLRHCAMMELLYATGMRVTELVTLPAAAIRGDPRMILVRGKGGKERMVPLSPTAREAGSLWLHQRDLDPATSKSAYLFPSRGKQGHITRIWFYKFIKDLAVQAKVDPSKVTPHTLRHAFATHLFGRWCRFAINSDTFGSRGRGNNRNLYPCARRPSNRIGIGTSSISQTA